MAIDALSQLESRRLLEIQEIQLELMRDVAGKNSTDDHRRLLRKNSSRRADSITP